MWPHVACAARDEAVAWHAVQSSSIILIYKAPALAVTTATVTSHKTDEIMEDL